ncbi:MAG TPA: hypothetical protein VGI81_23080 [Tepidisphaeraceae bacterium]
MAELQWERVFETCHRYGDGVLIAGAGLYVRDPRGLRQARVAPITGDEFAAMVDKLMSLGGVEEVAGAYRLLDLTYGDACRFRITIFGREKVGAVLLNLVGGPESERPSAGESRPAEDLELSLPSILQECVCRGGRDAVFVPDVSPLISIRSCLEALPLPPISAVAIAQMFRRLLERPASGQKHLRPALRSPYFAEPRDGHMTFDIPGPRGEAFRGAVFGWPMPRLAILMKLAPPKTSDTGWAMRD